MWITSAISAIAIAASLESATPKRTPDTTMDPHVVETMTWVGNQSNNLIQAQWFWVTPNGEQLTPDFKTLSFESYSLMQNITECIKSSGEIWDSRVNGIDHWATISITWFPSWIFFYDPGKHSLMQVDSYPWTLPDTNLFLSLVEYLEEFCQRNDWYIF